MKNVTYSSTIKSIFYKESRLAGKALIFLMMTLIAVIAFPLATIWSFNVLFDLGISYSFKSWLAVVILILTLQCSINIKRKKIYK